MPQTKLVLEPFITPVTQEQKLLNALGNLKATETRMVDLRESLTRLRKADIESLPNTRTLKVHTHVRTNGKKPTISCPEIILRGNWLERVGFSYDDQMVYIFTMDEMIVITPESKTDRRQRLRYP
jgi:hypothetical protein